jgi:hypothetical protein
MALNFLVSSSMNVSGRLIGAPEQAGFCSFNGFMTQFFVIQTDYWVLVIAICTYLILADYKRPSSWVQDNRKLLWLLPWFFSVLWASVGLGVTGYGDIGACKLTRLSCTYYTHVWICRPSHHYYVIG